MSVKQIIFIVFVFCQHIQQLFVEADKVFKTFKNNMICEMLFRFVASAILILLFVSSAFAHDSGSDFLVLCGNDTLTSVPGLESTVEALGVVNLYPKAPSKELGNIFNEIIAMTKKGQIFQVIGMIVRPSLQGNQIWINLEDTDKNPSPDSTKNKYWAFLGFQPDKYEVAEWNFSKIPIE